MKKIILMVICSVFIRNIYSEVNCPAPGITLDEIQEGVNWSGCDLKGIKFADEKPIVLEGATLSEVDLRGHKFEKLEGNKTHQLDQINLRGANLGGTWFYDVDLKKADLTDATITPDTKFFGNTDLTGAIWTDGQICKNKDCSQKEPRESIVSEPTPTVTPKTPDEHQRNEKINLPK